MRIVLMIVVALAMKSPAVAQDVVPLGTPPTGLQDIAIRIGDKLHLARREADLKQLQTEVGLLRSKLGLGESEIRVSVKVLEIAHHRLFDDVSDDARKSVLAKYVPQQAGTTEQPFYWGESDPLLRQIDAWLADPEKPVKLLADPTLTTLSGKAAFVNIGGEFPIAVPQPLGALTVEYRRYGTQLDIFPTLRDDGSIKLEVRPRVSRIDPSRSITLNGQKVPRLMVREMDVNVTMRPKQILAIGGFVGEPFAGVKANSTSKNNVNGPAVYEMVVLISADVVPPKPADAPTAASATIEAAKRR